MTAWTDRSIEEKALLNPAFCASLIWNFALVAGEQQGQRPLTFAEAYLVLPVVLPKGSRESLPRSTRTSLATWLDENPSFQATLVARTRAMVPFTKEALIFGGTRQLFQISAESINANTEWKRRANAVLRQSSLETQACLKKAAFLGSWFIETGSANTVMALMGVRP
ncbi:hypothetical protein A1507_17570 [Methylomonas koyamae]|uniref:Uncharacterized protein n=1 Tax=Methylomonas koyamae TaxID=702114 RepID=A0A177N584_9GAMM|nr:three component ABC system middle component [Methylomonas koyamae]OAI13178.1 hypothetical protein A1507_17570 [Methylomonas koyamae]